MSSHSQIRRPTPEILIVQAHYTAQLRGGTCLSDNYIPTPNKMKWCCKYGHEWKMALGSVKDGEWCPVCYSLKMRQPKREEKSSINWDDRIPYRDKYKYRMICKRCNKDMGYQRSGRRYKWCCNCGHLGKKSGKKGRPLSAEMRLKIAQSNLVWRTKQNPNYRKLTKQDHALIQGMRIRVHHALFNGHYTKNASFIKSLGCEIHQLRTHLESLFKPGMSWDNYGIMGWHIDHVIPLSSFNLSDPSQFKKACHFSNLQPLWAAENWSKGSKLHG